MSVITELTWASMTAAINDMKSPNSFITKLLYGVHEPKSTEVIEIDTWVRGRVMAPFVTKNSEALPIDGPSQTKAIVEAPNIRIKRSIKPHEVMFGRTPGSVIFPSTGDQTTEIENHMAKELQPLADDISNRIEWMCAQTLTGVLTYNVETADQVGGDAFVIDYNRSAGNSVDVSGGTTNWNGGATADIIGDIKRAKRQVNKQVGGQVTDAIVGELVSDAFMADSAVQALLDKRNILLGELDFTRQFDEDGVMFLGTIAGVRFWEYIRTATEPTDGSTVDMIRPKFVEFVSRSNIAEFTLYFGAIADLTAFQERTWVGERFAKSKVEFDPSVITGLAHSRPLPVPRRPDATYSLEVIP